MHETANISGQFFAMCYGKPGQIVLDIGGLNVNGSLREHFVSLGMTFISVDMVEHESVDVVIKPNEKLPFETGSVDLIVSTSCFEHDPCFWMTFREMTRLVKVGGFIYVNAPSNGIYHGYPGDSWRFYADAGQSLALWSAYQIGNEDVYPTKVLETFHILPKGSQWIDFVCVWQRIQEKDIGIRNTVAYGMGSLEQHLNINNYPTEKIISKW